MGKKVWSAALAASLSASIMASAGSMYASEPEQAESVKQTAEETVIELSDSVITVDGVDISEDASAAVYAGADVVYYQEGQDGTYGEGGEDDGHSQEEAAQHTVITITRPGSYRVTGSISKGQIAVDLGEDAQDDEAAVVNLILDQADITCTVAPAIVVYSAYECGSDDEETAAKDVDTCNAGFHLILADGSENTVTGSHVAKIYREGTTQEEVDAGEAKKAWKFDAAIDSLVSFEIDKEEDGTGKLSVISDNEGIESALHLTINGGEITIHSADDAVNASEDGVSVLTINDGTVICDAGLGKEGDGIDSNGWIVINGGTVVSSANKDSQDSGVDADLGIYINGGTVFASGNMYDDVSADSGQMFMVLNFSEPEEGGQLLMLKDGSGRPVAAFSAANTFQTMVYSSGSLTEGDYTLYEVTSVTGDEIGGIYTDITAYSGEAQLQYGSDSMTGPGGQKGFGGSRGDFKGGERPEEFDDGKNQLKPGDFGDGERPSRPENFEEGEGMPRPDNFEEGEMPKDQESGSVFSLNGIRNMFSQITRAADEEI